MTKNNNFITICLYLVIVICFIFIITNVCKKNFKEGMTTKEADDKFIKENPTATNVTAPTKAYEDKIFGTGLPSDSQFNPININKAPYDYFTTLELEAYMPTMQDKIFFPLTKGIANLNPKQKALKSIEATLDMSKNSIDTAKQFIATETKYLNLLGLAGLNSDWETVPPNFVEYYNEKMKFLNSMSQFLNQYNNNNGNSNGNWWDLGSSNNSKSSNNWWNFGRDSNNKSNDKSDSKSNGDSNKDSNDLQDAWNSTTSGAQDGWQSIQDDFGWNKKK